MPSVTRAQMAVFLLKTKYGSSYVTPPGAGVFGEETDPVTTRAPGLVPA